MKVSGFLLTAIALTYLYFWRSGQTHVLTPAAPVAVGTPGSKLAQVAP